MGFWQHLAESYDKNADALQKDYPLSTTSISNNSDIIVIIVIDGNGDFIRCDKIDKKSNSTRKNSGNPLVNVKIPVTEESLGRSSGVSPHPVFDQYGYLKGEGKKYDDYIEKLKRFAESGFATEQVRAIYKYVAKRTVASDMSEMQLEDKTNIVFQVEILGSPRTKTWEEIAFFDAWHQYYVAEKLKLVERKKWAEEKLASEKKLPANEKKKLKEETKLNNRVSLDYITGEQQLIATSHPKKISNASGNSKLVSDNDKSNYT
ncbi:MAG: type I-C CRISPR-associated protein Cas8c/Csd1, partial [FCB group bacterium]|nr:type I-C CRISPR-associated protein Cas8c/Csd1 [FCB group bacterium]